MVTSTTDYTCQTIVKQKLRIMRSTLVGNLLLGSDFTIYPLLLAYRQSRLHNLRICRPRILMPAVGLVFGNSHRVSGKQILIPSAQGPFVILLHAIKLTYHALPNCLDIHLYTNGPNCQNDPQYSYKHIRHTEEQCSPSECKSKSEQYSTGKDNQSK